MNPLFQIIPMWTPFLPTNCSKPPTIYSLLQSIVNYDENEITSTSNLAKNGRFQIFDFNYPLSSHVDKEYFECMILNHFMMRRIGYETLTAFKLALNVKLNEIMQNYNLLFDALYEWSLFDNGEIVTRNVSDSRSKHNTISGTNATQTSASGTSSDSTSLTGTTSDSTTSDRRYSNMPNNQISNVQDGSYLSEYNYDHNTGTGSSSSTGTSSGTSSNTTNVQGVNAENSTLTDAGTLLETITRSNDDTKQLDILIKFTENKKNIYSMIFKDLDVLFYQL